MRAQHRVGRRENVFIAKASLARAPVAMPCGRAVASRLRGTGPRTFRISPSISRGACWGNLPSTRTKATWYAKPNRLWGPRRRAISRRSASTEGGIADPAGAGDVGVGDRPVLSGTNARSWPNSSTASTSSSRRPLPGRPPEKRRLRVELTSGPPARRPPGRQRTSRGSAGALGQIVTVLDAPCQGQRRLRGRSRRTSRIEGRRLGT